MEKASYMKAITDHQQEALEQLITNLIGEVGFDSKSGLEEIITIAKKGYFKIYNYIGSKSDRWMESDKGQWMIQFQDEWESFVKDTELAISKIKTFSSIEIDSSNPEFDLVIFSGDGDIHKLYIPPATIEF